MHKKIKAELQAVRERYYKRAGTRHGKIGEHLKFRNFAVDRTDDAKMVWFAERLNLPVSELYRQITATAVKHLERKHGKPTAKDLARLMA